MRQTLILLIALLPTQLPAQKTEFQLPRDNGSTASFSEKCLFQANGDPCPIECIASTIRGSRKMLWSRCCPSEGLLDCKLVFEIRGRTVSCLVQAMVRHDTLTYTFDCYTVDGIPIDVWVERNRAEMPVLVERIQSTVFVETVLMIFEMKRSAS